MAVSLLRQTVTGGSSFTPNALLYGYFVINMTGDITINAPTLATDGQFLAVTLINNTGAQRAVTWHSSYKQSPGILPTSIGGGGDVCCQIFFYDDGDCRLIHQGS